MNISTGGIGAFCSKCLQCVLAAPVGHARIHVRAANSLDLGTLLRFLEAIASSDAIPAAFSAFRHSKISTDSVEGPTERTTTTNVRLVSKFKTSCNKPGRM